MLFLETIDYVIFIFLLSYYLITNLQWFGYRLSRVAVHHTKPRWNVYYLYAPIVINYVLLMSNKPIWQTTLLFLVYVPALFLWHKKIDKKLVFTGRVKRFFALLLGFTVFFVLLKALHILPWAEPVLPIVLSVFVAEKIEKVLFLRFQKKAKKKILSNENLTVIAITASYGKTSIKNFLFALLDGTFKTYATPRSVNTVAGICKNINDELPQGTEVYIVEAGARQKGDIEEIAQLVQPHYAVVGKIGAAHIEYFKSLENIKQTKLELLISDRLKQAYLYDEIECDAKNALFFGYKDGSAAKVSNVLSSLKGLTFEMHFGGDTLHLSAPMILGSFNAINICAAACTALSLGVPKEIVLAKVAALKPTEHRLQKIEALGKLIIDDSFNGNFDGISEGIRLCSGFNGRKTIVTCGLVESEEGLNIALAKQMDEVFDAVIVTGSVNAKVYDENIKNAKKIFLPEKSQLQTVLATETAAGELIYFANDAPSFV